MQTNGARLRAQKTWVWAQLCLGFPGGSAGKESAVMWETWVPSLSWEDPPGEGNSYPLQYSGLENSMDCIAHGVAKSRTQLSNFHFTHQRSGSWGGGPELLLRPPPWGDPALPTPGFCAGMLIADFRSPDRGGKGISIVLRHPRPAPHTPRPSLWLFVGQPRERLAMCL